MKERLEFTRFKASDEAGRELTVIGYQNYVSHNPVYGHPVRLKAEVEYLTETGKALTQVNADSFRLGGSRERITRLPEASVK